MSGIVRRKAECNSIMPAYPSPIGDGMDGEPFYTRDAQHPSQEEVNQETSQDNTQSDSSHSSDAQLQADTRPHNLEELQLAAQQISQRLADGSALGVEISSLNAEHLADPTLRDIMPQPGNDQSAVLPYLPRLAGQLPVGQSPSAAQQPAQYPAAQTPPRKRSKVSRACDECRRKKIKCDAQSDAGEVACGNCIRASVSCLFSRVPQKRGPSKGFVPTCSSLGAAGI
jgi:hypothetical protein